jgi:hypothetical protein
MSTPRTFEGVCAAGHRSSHVMRLGRADARTFTVCPHPGCNCLVVAVPEVRQPASVALAGPR